MQKRSFVVSALALFAAATLASAAQVYLDGEGDAIQGQSIASIVVKFLNGSNKAVGVSSTNPLPTADAQNAAFGGAVAMTAGQAATAQRGIGALCTAAGNLTFTFSDASTLTLPAYVGWQTWPFSVTTYSLPGSAPATCTVYEMK